MIKLSDRESPHPVTAWEGCLGGPGGLMLLRVMDPLSGEGESRLIKVNQGC